MPGPEAHGTHRGGALRQAHVPASEEEERPQVLRPDRRGLRGPRGPRRGPVRGRGAADRGEQHEGLSAPPLQGWRQALHPHGPAGSDPKVYGLLRRGRGAPAFQAGRGRVAAEGPEGSGRGQEAGRGPGGPIRQARLSLRLRLLPRHPLAAEAGKRLPLRGDPGSASVHPGGEGGHGEPPAHGPAPLRGRGLRQDRGGHPGGLQGRSGREAGGAAVPYHHPGPAAFRHRQRAVRRFSRDRGAASVASRPPRSGRT